MALGGGFLVGVRGWPWGAEGNPLADFLDCIGREAFAFWGHLFIGLGRGEESEERALVGFTGNDVWRVEFSAVHRGAGAVESVSGLLLFGAVTFDAVFGEERFDVGLEIECSGGKREAKHESTEQTDTDPDDVRHP